ncbi:MAG: acyltransferase [Clostridia bacterium]|nr:acyltransferase [Clostridia bacterium]
MERNDYIDYAKALCIVLVVFIHTGFSALNNIILFAMPMFFAATGYTFSFGKRSFTQNYIRRFKSILIPYFLLMLFYTLIEIFRANLFGYGDASMAYPSFVNTVYGSGIVPLSGGIFDKIKIIMSYKAQPQVGVDLILPSNCHLWFLPAMFTGYVIFIALVKAGRRNHLLKTVIILCLILFASVEVVLPQFRQMPFALGRGAIGAAFMLFGFWIKDYKLFDNKTNGYYVLTNCIALVLFISALHLGSDGSAFVRSVYGPYGVFSVFATFVGGVSGTWLLLSLCKVIEKLPLDRFKKLLSHIGRNVMTIYAWHMAVKFLFDAVYIRLIKSSDFSMLDEYKMGLMPQNSMCFMLFEAVAIIVVCLLLNKLKPVEKIKKIWYN